MADVRELGLAALREGDPAAAAVHLFEAARTAPDDVQVIGALGVALCEAGRVDEGVRVLRRALAIAPNEPGLRFNLARGLELLGQRAEAVASYRLVLDHAPGHAQSIEALTRLAAGAPPPGEAPPAPESTPAGGSPFPLNVWEADAVSEEAPPARQASPVPPPPYVSPAPPRRAPGPARPAPPPRGSAGRIGALAGVAGLVAGVGVLVYYALTASAEPPYRPSARLTADVPVARSSTASPARSRETGLSAAPGGAGDPSGGPKVVDTIRGFSFRMPAGFTKPAPQQQPPLPAFGVRATCTIYEHSGPTGYAFVVCYVLSEAAFDGREPEELLTAAESVALTGADRISRTPGSAAPGSPDRIVSYETQASGKRRAGRLHIVVERPRIWVIGFEAPDADGLEATGVREFLDSLTVSPVYRTTRGTLSTSPAPPP